ncbi:MAG: TlpA family protein disulfide reductase [Methylococcaceae bacterium]|nr:TlpA family protein disulfide reductase [Methylococcaceae bacterium]
MRCFLLLFYLLVIHSTAVKAMEINSKVVSCSAVIETEQTNMDLQKFRGKVVYLDFWATWCPPCKKSMPFLNALRNELHDQGFEVIAVNVDEDSDDARQFLQQYPVDYLVAMDPTGQCPQQYDVKAMPSAYFIDRKGIIRHIHLGFRERDKQQIRSLILDLLAEK